MIDQTENNSHEYLQKFGYRVYQKELTGRKSRVFSLIWFELTSTWNRSTLGKVLLVILMVINFITLTVSVGSSEAILVDLEGQQDEVIRDALNRFAANYIAFAGEYIHPGTHETGLRMNPPVAILFIALIAIAGSGFFADDKHGKVIEIYLSRIQKKEYVIGKIGAIIIYINVFLMIPLLVVGALNVQAITLTSHLDQWDYYVGIIFYSTLTSIILGLAILVLSSLVEKRAYASLAFFMIYVLGARITQILISSNKSNEFLILLNPSHFFALLAYVCLFDYKLGIGRGFEGGFEGVFLGSVEPLILNDGTGLEYYHILGVALLLIITLGSFLAFKIHRLTTEEL
ncbi:MAG: hypothetical protein ACXAD7_17330 [Candidatus Kariarchaeaceae archaeon]